MNNKKISELFDEIADMLELSKENRIFEIRAYRKAALTLDSMQEDISEILQKKGIDGLLEIQGIGKGLALKIEEFVKTGKIKKYEELKKKYPIDFSTLTKIQGLGSKRAYVLYKNLGVKNIEDLKKAIKTQKVRELSGFGEKSEKELEKGIQLLESSKGRILLGTALPEAESVIKKLKDSGLVEKVILAGSTRRMKETVGDLDILVISNKAKNVMDFVITLPEVENIIANGPTKTTVWLKIGISCDIRVLEKESFGAAQQYFIGSKDHNVKIRQIAIKKGYKLNEYGLYDLKGKIISSEDEKDIYEKLGMQYPEPEMRENKGEIELAQENKLPKLVQLNDILGDLHTHSKHSDGMNSIEEMANEAIKLGRKYIGITDHSKSEYIANGMDEKRIISYFKEIDQLNKKFEGRIKILKSAETDILKDGSLDFKKDILKEMDYVLASIHTNLNMSKEEMTKRIITAIESGVNIFAHPTDRLINQRNPIVLDFDAVFQAAKDNNVILEIDSYPNRLDLNDENIFRAKKYDLTFSISTDSHRTDHLSLMRYGVGMAKRGWLTKNDVVNTLPYEKLCKLFGR
ncbi:MAG: DNA polymerase/3'-5' exonuclease PolX [Candidatus Micrarchaeaceae archaeon]